MRLTLEIRHVSIPFRFAYGHAKASHRGVDSVICIARDTDGHAGYGEAVPRSYVTGETCASVMEEAADLGRELIATETAPAALRRAVLEKANDHTGAFPSCAMCAIELALLDLHARRECRPLYSQLGAAKPVPLTYAGSIGIAMPARLTALLLAYRSAGLRSFKMKVGGSRDIHSLQLARRILGGDARIFVDANGAWGREEAASRIEALHKAGVWAIEEPLRRPEPEPCAMKYDCEKTLNEKHFSDCAWLRARSPIPLIADESAISLRSVHSLIEHGAFDIIDIRLSKLGGTSISSEVASLAHANGMRFYVGAMVGESAILASAGSHFGTAHPDHLHMQGHSHRALHRVAVASGGPTLRRGGRLQVTDAPGLGVRLHQRTLDKLTTMKRMVST